MFEQSGTVGSYMAFALGGACSQARWSLAETYTSAFLAGNWPLPPVFDLQSSFQMLSNFCSILKILAKSMPAFVDGET